ncbi:MAG: 50S ribosomal protein L17 [FCB group bacterium]|jgi:large subunit ribosomal protein L17
MRHQVRGRKLNRTSSHRKALLRNLATALFQHKKIATTEAKAKELRPYAEHLITKAKHALHNEKNQLLPDGQTVDIHNRRIVGRDIRSKAVLQELFDTIAPLVEERPGGYCRITKTGLRRGDSGQAAIIELVDWSAPQDGTVSLKARKKAQAKKTAGKTRRAAKKAAAAHEAEEAEALETATETTEEVQPEVKKKRGRPKKEKEIVEEVQEEAVEVEAVEEITEVEEEPETETSEEITEEAEEEPEPKKEKKKKKEE